MAEIQSLLQIMARLRDPDGGCPWDLEQDFDTIAPYTIEEAYEVDDAVRRRDWDDLRAELGDLLLQVVFHAQMAREKGVFGFEDVVEEICNKLIRRHPHIFEQTTIESAEAQKVAWDGFKERERAERASREGRPASVMDDVPTSLPALLRCAKLQRRAERAGLAWEARERRVAALGQLLGEPDPVAAGDWLFACARVVARAGIDPEQAAREAAARFEREFRDSEATAAPAVDRAGDSKDSG